MTKVVGKKMDVRDMPRHTHMAPTWHPPPALYTNAFGKFQTQDLKVITSMLQQVFQMLISDTLSYVIKPIT